MAHDVKLDIPRGPFGGYIFDCDGTLIDSMPVHYRAWKSALAQLGARAPLDEDLFYSFGGVPTRRTAELYVERFGLSATPDQLFHLKEKHFVEALEQVPLVDAVVAFAREVAKSHPVSVASGGPREVVHRSLKLAGLWPLFPIVVTADDVVHGKPAPDMFLLAAEKMGVRADRCLVFEDAAPGIQAAEAAGMRWVHVETRAKSPQGPDGKSV